MKYYPLSQVKTGYTSNVGEFILKHPLNTIKNKRENLNNITPEGYYVGEYWKTADESYYTGSSQTDPKGVYELLKISTENDVEDKPQPPYINDDLIGDNILSFDLEPHHVYTDPDYKYNKQTYQKTKNHPKRFYNWSKNIDFEARNRGFVYRYFSKNKITSEIIEINNKEYNSIKGKDKSYHWELYSIMRIKWNNHESLKSNRSFNIDQIFRAEILGFTGLYSYLISEL